MPASCPPRDDNTFDPKTTNDVSPRAAASPREGASRRNGVGTTSWVVLLPLKLLASAKSRLRRPDRGDLAMAMALDTVSAALAVDPAVVAVVAVVTDDPRARATLQRHAASRSAVDRLALIREGDDGGLNPALRQAAALARRRWPDLGIAALSADLAALRPAELSLALRRAPAAGRGLVADAAGTGTVLLTASPGLDLSPSFGPDSQQVHLASGAVDLTAGLGDRVAGLRRDVDTVADLAAASRLGVGPATAAVLRAAS